MTGRAQPRRAARTDSNQVAVVKALRAAGCVVVVAGLPMDLWVGYQGAWWPAECKDGDKPPSRRKLTDVQTDFAMQCEEAELPWLLLTSPVQAVELVCGEGKPR